MATTTLQLYKYTGPLKTINKTLPTPTKKTGTQVEPPQSVLECDFIITGTAIPEYNYAYVSTFKRYYFVTDVTWLGGNAFQLHLKCDVLFTNKTKINALTAMIRYSVQGDMLEEDPRLNKKDYLTRYKYNEYTYYHRYKDSTSGNTPYILLRYHYIPPRQSAPGVPPSSASSIRYTIMDAASWSDFCAAFCSALLTDAKREAIAKAIIDVSELYYIDDTRLAASSLEYSNNHITFTTPDYPDGINVSTTDFGAHDNFYTSTDPIADASTLGYYDVPAFEIPFSEYQFISAEYMTHLPFIGDISVIPLKMGIVAPYFGYYSIRIDPLGNQYVLRPYTVDGTGQDIPIIYPDHVKIFPNPKRRGFFYNDSLNRAEWNKLALYTKTARDLLVGDLSAPFKAYEAEMNLDARTAAATQYKGDYGDGAEYSLVAHPAMYNVINRTDYETDRYSFWITWGYPDHQVRAIQDLQAGTYFECEKVDMRSFSTITKTEVDEIETLLMTGVYA